MSELSSRRAGRSVRQDDRQNALKRIHNYYTVKYIILYIFRTYTYACMNMYYMDYTYIIILLSVALHISVFRPCVHQEVIKK
jgi:hypothetical protein